MNNVTSNLRTKKQRRRTACTRVIKTFRYQLFNAKPSSMSVANKETRAAIEDARNGNGQRYTSLGVMWADLGSY